MDFLIDNGNHYHYTPISIVQKSTPLLVPLIENGGAQWLPSVLEYYRTSMIKNDAIECLILGCTHYSILKKEIKDITKHSVSLISQDEIIPDKLINYLNKHPGLNEKIDKNGKSDFYVSDVTENYCESAEQIYGDNIDIKLAKFDTALNKLTL